MKSHFLLAAIVFCWHPTLSLFAVAQTALMVDDTISLDGTPSDPFTIENTIGNFFQNDDNTQLFRVTTDPLPEGTLLSCTISCNQAWQIVLSMAIAATYNEGDAQVIVPDGACPTVTGQFEAATTNTGWVAVSFIHLEFLPQQLTDATLACSQVGPMSTDGTITVNGAATASFDLAEHATNDATTQVFQMDIDPIPSGTTVSCTIDCDDGMENIYMYMKYAASFNFPGDGTLVVDGSSGDRTCPQTGELEAQTSNTGWVSVYTSGGGSGLVNAQVSCTAPISPTPTGPNPNVPPANDDPIAPAPFITPSPAPCACFSGDTLVQVQGKGPTRMKDLQVNDAVFVGSSLNTRKPIYQKVYAFGHRDTSAITEYLSIHASSATNGDPLEVSPAHLMFVLEEDHPIRADKIQVGDTLLEHHVHLPATTRNATVSKIDWVTRKGVYMPLTSSGSIVVNNLQASVYVSIKDEAPIIVAWLPAIVSEHQLMHWWLVPHRLVCLGLSSSAICHKHDSNGLLFWLGTGRYLSMKAESFCSWATDFAYVFTGFLLGFGIAGESFLGYFSSLCMLFVLVIGLIRTKGSRF